MNMIISTFMLFTLTVSVYASDVLNKITDNTLHAYDSCDIIVRMRNGSSGDIRAVKRATRRILGSKKYNPVYKQRRDRSDEVEGRLLLTVSVGKNGSGTGYGMYRWDLDLSEVNTSFEGNREIGLQQYRGYTLSVFPGTGRAGLRRALRDMPVCKN